MPEFIIANRKIGPDHPPFVIAEIGINHEGHLEKAVQMVKDAHEAGCECVKFQCHVVEDEMIRNSVIPGNADESIWNIVSRCALTEAEDRTLQEFTTSLGMIYLSTPFSRAAANRLEAMNVPAYKIGSGECNNYPLIRHIASLKKPVILSTGMNDIASIAPAVNILHAAHTPYAILHCTSLYPTPYEDVRLGCLAQLQEAFPDTVIGLSDHSLHNWTSFAAIPLGASILEKHFTSDPTWPGPDVPISITPRELQDLILGANAIHQALGGNKTILQKEKPTIDFAYACVVSIRKISAGDTLSMDNIWVKRPGTGSILACDFEQVLGRKAVRDILPDEQLNWNDFN